MTLGGRIVRPAIAWVSIGAGLGSCAGERSVLDGLDRSDEAVGHGAIGAGRRVLASAGGRDILEGDLLPALLEIGGGEALREAVLDHELERLARERGITIGQDELRRERQRLSRALLAGSGDEDEERGGRVLEDLRAQRGLGATRFEAMLRRNAIMRALVRDEIQVTPEDVERAFEIVFGERIAARLIVVASDREAADIRGTLLRGSGDLPSRFAAIARARSIDPSGTVGGELAPLSLVDPSIPGSLRRALASGDVGSMTPVVSLDGAFAVALIEGRLPRVDTTLERERATLERVLKERREREAMTTLAERLVRESGVVVIDRSLSWSWERGER